VRLYCVLEKILTDTDYKILQNGYELKKIKIQAFCYICFSLIYLVALVLLQLLYIFCAIQDVFPRHFQSTHDVPYSVNSCSWRAVKSSQAYFL